MKKKPNGLNHFYYWGQVFDLDQKTMNEMIEDIRELLAQIDELEERLQDFIEEEK